MRLTICGCRGSIPVTGAGFQKIGGDTPCIAVAHGDAPATLILDAGSGIRRAGRLLDGSPFQGSVLLTQLHWDHTQGLPFFAAGDREGSRVRLALPAQEGEPLAVLGRAMSPPFFPITPLDLRGDWRFEDYGEGETEIEGFTVLAREVPHGGGRTMGLRVSDGRSAFAYLPDHAPQAIAAGEDGLGALHEAAVALADGVDLLIHDAQYTAEELPTHAGFGHAAAEYAEHLARHCGVGRLLLFHHDPDRTDDEVGAIVATLRGRGGLAVDAAADGMVVDL